MYVFLCGMSFQNVLLIENKEGIEHVSIVLKICLSLYIYLDTNALSSLR